MYYFYVEIEYVATSFSPARMDLAVKLLIDAAAAPWVFFFPTLAGWGGKALCMNLNWCTATTVAVLNSAKCLVSRCLTPKGASVTGRTSSSSSFSASSSVSFLPLLSATNVAVLNQPSASPLAASFQKTHHQREDHPLCHPIQHHPWYQSWHSSSLQPRIRYLTCPSSFLQRCPSVDYHCWYPTCPSYFATLPFSGRESPFLFAADVECDWDREDTECPWDVATKLLNVRERVGVEYAMGGTAPAPLPCQVVAPNATCKMPAELLPRRGEWRMLTLIPRPPPGRPPRPPWQLWVTPSAKELGGDINSLTAKSVLTGEKLVATYTIPM